MNSDQTVIETQDLTKKYGDFTAVDGLNLQIREGEIFGFLGPNGAGKTTSIRMMVGLLNPTSGEVRIEGMKNSSVEEKVGICPQDLVIWDELTAYENIRFMGNMYDVPKKELKKRTDKLLEDLQLTDKRDNLASELSGGMKRRLNLGMSLVHDPEIVVLDEPSAGLDPQTRYSVWEYIKELRGGEDRCIILTTHLMEEADRVSDRVGIIDRGELLVVDTPENLKKSVGEGDSIKIELNDKRKNDQAVETLKANEEVLQASEVNNMVLVRALDAVGKMDVFTEALEESGLTVSDISISQTNTLEDVFIHLTGRGLN
ncbi:ABC transporter ATP-binding protein [Candidatus Bipolaricaulota bacterium]|nr:ABC transporter ATP-binding protein [Candidatus Bipolaricaulota bacterium]